MIPRAFLRFLAECVRQPARPGHDFDFPHADDHLRSGADQLAAAEEDAEVWEPCPECGVKSEPDDTEWHHPDCPRAFHPDAQSEQLRGAFWCKQHNGLTGHCPQDCERRKWAYEDGDPISAFVPVPAPASLDDVVTRLDRLIALAEDIRNLLNVDAPPLITPSVFDIACMASDAAKSHDIHPELANTIGAEVARGVVDAIKKQQPNK